jgi:hypothetical protein
MRDSVLNQYLQPKPERVDGDDLEDARGAIDDLGAFGWLRGIHERALMLELRRKDGNIVAFGYAWLEHADFDPSEGITLHFGVKKIKITGRHLNTEIRSNVRLFAGLVRHRVPWIQESDERSALTANPAVTVIEQFEF